MLYAIVALLAVIVDQWVKYWVAGNIPLESAVNEAKATKGKPTMIIARSIKGRGVSFMENEASWHGAAPNDEQYALAIAELNEYIKELGGNC